MIIYGINRFRGSHANLAAATAVAAAVVVVFFLAPLLPLSPDPLTLSVSIVPLAAIVCAFAGHGWHAGMAYGVSGAARFGLGHPVAAAGSGPVRGEHVRHRPGGWGATEFCAASCFLSRGRRALACWMQPNTDRVDRSLIGVVIPLVPSEVVMV